MSQSRSDLAGKSHSHGWGVATFENDAPHVERQAWAAYHGEHFARAASRIYADVVLAHVRRATVGGSSIHNTHPFTHGGWVFAHNGTVPHFERIRERLIENVAPALRKNIKGETDSEHVFYYLLTEIQKNSEGDIHLRLKDVIAKIEQWVREIDSEVKIGLNLLLTDGERIFGSRFGRSLYYIERDGVYDCEICGFPHIHHQPNREYQALVVASEPITHEDWNVMPDRSVWNATSNKAEISITSI